MEQAPELTTPNKPVELRPGDDQTEQPPIKRDNRRVQHEREQEQQCQGDREAGDWIQHGLAWMQHVQLRYHEQQETRQQSSVLPSTELSCPEPQQPQQSQTPAELREPEAARRPMSISSAVTEVDENAIESQDIFINLDNSPSLHSSAVTQPTKENPETQRHFTRKHLLGPDKPISTRLLSFLIEWHESYPDTQPPCSLRARPKTWQPFRVFDHDGAELQLSIHEISFHTQKKTLTYSVMILHPETGPEELVAFAKTRPPCSGGIMALYFVAWLGIPEQFEASACAVRVWRRDNQKIVFRSELFDYADSDVQPWRFATSTTYRDPASAPPIEANDLSDAKNEGDKRVESSQSSPQELKFKNCIAQSLRSAKTKSPPNQQPVTPVRKRLKTDSSENTASTDPQNQVTSPKGETSTWFRTQQQQYHEHMRSRQEIASLRQEIAFQRQKITSQQQEIVSQRQENALSQDIASQQIASLRQTIASQQQEIASQREKISSQRHDIASQRQKIASQLASQRQGITSRQQQNHMDSLRQEIASQRQEIASLNEENTSQYQKIASQRQEIASLGEENASQHQAITSQRQEIDSQQKEFTAQRQNIASQQQQIACLRAQIRRPNNFPNPSQFDQQKRPPQYSPALGRHPQGNPGNHSPLPQQQRGPQQARQASSPRSGEHPTQAPKHQPSQPAKPRPNTALEMLTTRGNTDPELRGLIRAVASRQASQEQRRAFQAHINEFNAIIKAREQQEQRQQAAGGTVSQPQ